MMALVYLKDYLESKQNRGSKELSKFSKTAYVLQKYYQMLHL